MSMVPKELERAQDCVRQCRTLCTFRTVLLALGEDLDIDSASTGAAAALTAAELVRRVRDDVGAACARRQA